MNVVNTILFPSRFFDGKKVDEDLQSEYETTLNTGLWDTVFFNYDKWLLKENSFCRKRFRR